MLHERMIAFRNLVCDVPSCAEYQRQWNTASLFLNHVDNSVHQQYDEDFEKALTSAPQQLTSATHEFKWATKEVAATIGEANRHPQSPTSHALGASRDDKTSKPNSYSMVESISRHTADSRTVSTSSFPPGMKKQEDRKNKIEGSSLSQGWSFQCHREKCEGYHQRFETNVTYREHCASASHVAATKKAVSRLQTPDIVRAQVLARIVMAKPDVPLIDSN